MATKYVNATDIKGGWTTVSTTPVASGDILVVSGFNNPYNGIIISLGGSTPSGTWTISAGDYDNGKAYTSPTFSGASYKAIGGLDGTRVAQSDDTIEFTCTTSGNVMAIYN
jgi:hypothetical protein